MNILSNCSRSAENYLALLKKRGGGCVKFGVSEIDKRKRLPFSYILKLIGQPRSIDNAKIRIDGKDFESGEIRICSYSQATGTVEITLLSDTAKTYFNKKDIIAKINVVIDLLFLVERVRDWYSSGKYYPSIPSKTSNVAIDCLSSQPSEDQLEAISGALRSPFSYIWGAPGTGKTSIVLSECILAYTKAEKRVLITAPTNNAIEQSLSVVLPKLRSIGFDLSRVIRLGVPSSTFFTNYPEVCESNDVEQRVAALIKQRTYLDECLSTLHRAKILDDANPLFKLLYDSLDKHAEQTISIIALKYRIEAISIELRDVETELRNIESSIVQTNRDIENLKKRISRRVFGKKRLADALQTVTDYMVTLQRSRREKSEILLVDKKDIDNCNAELKQAESSISNLSGEIQAIKILIIEKLSSVADLQDICISIEKHNNVDSFDGIQHEFEHLQALNKEKVLLIPSYVSDPNKSSSENVTHVANLIEETEKLLDVLKPKSIKDRIKECLVLAATIDTCIALIKPDGDFIPHHVFMDEAAYCPLIKGITLLAYDCPVTFLGDHMQLPPVCEASVLEIKNDPSLTLWAQSTLYAEEAFSLSISDLYKAYDSSTPPPFLSMERFDLTCTYRFGEDVADILAGKVYSPDFHSIAPHNTQVFFVNAEHTGDDHAKSLDGKPLNRTSLSEIIAIRQYIETHSGEDIGIITPYRNQLEQLKKNLTGFDTDSIVTVHGSQGREWHTVILSIVDRKRNAYFTNSSLCVGLLVLNTAISRVKSKLIIVCDFCDWIIWQKQFVTAFLNIGTEMIISSNHQVTNH